MCESLRFPSYTVCNKSYSNKKKWNGLVFYTIAWDWVSGIKIAYLPLRACEKNSIDLGVRL